MTRRSPLDALPLFATDRELGAALLGAKRAAEWVALAPALERRGLPLIDPLMGGRYTPAVRAFFDRLYGMAPVPVASENAALEDHSRWNRTSKRRA